MTATYGLSAPSLCGCAGERVHRDRGSNRYLVVAHDEDGTSSRPSFIRAPRQRLRC